MGVVQSDVLIREAVRSALREIRDNPDIIDDVFQELLEDDLSSGRYGDTTIEAARTWFLNTAIKVKLGLQVSQADLPCVAIALMPTSEAEATIGDVDMDAPSEVDPDDASRSRSRYGVMSNETYSIAVFCHGEPEHCLFLYSLLLYSLLRVKFKWLDQRGFMVSTFQTGAFTQAETDMEQIYTRSINLTGKVRHVWYGDWQGGGPLSSVDINTPPTVPAGFTIMSDPAVDLDALADLDMLQGIKRQP